MSTEALTGPSVHEYMSTEDPDFSHYMDRVHRIYRKYGSLPKNNLAANASKAAKELKSLLDSFEQHVTWEACLEAKQKAIGVVIEIAREIITSGDGGSKLDADIRKKVDLSRIGNAIGWINCQILTEELAEVKGNGDVSDELRRLRELANAHKLDLGLDESIDELAKVEENDSEDDADVIQPNGAPDFAAYAAKVRQILNKYDSLDDRMGHLNAIKAEAKINAIVESIAVQTTRESPLTAKQQAINATVEIALAVVNTRSELGDDLKRDLEWGPVKSTISHVIDTLLPEELTTLQRSGEAWGQLLSLRSCASIYSLNLRINDSIDKLYLQEAADRQRPVKRARMT